MQHHLKFLLFGVSWSVKLRKPLISSASDFNSNLASPRYTNSPSVTYTLVSCWLYFENWSETKLSFKRAMYLLSLIHTSDNSCRRVRVLESKVCSTSMRGNNDARLTTTKMEGTFWPDQTQDFSQLDKRINSDSLTLRSSRFLPKGTSMLQAKKSRAV